MSQRPTLRFSPRAWAKLLYLRELGPTEVGGFGICRVTDLLYVDDFVLIEQDCSPVTVAFNDEAVAAYFDLQIDAERRPEQFARIWIHTHPGNSAQPSGVDEETFARVFGRSDWAIMAILARDGQTYARLQFHTGPVGSWQIPVSVDWSLPFEGTDWVSWKRDYEQRVRLQKSHSFVWSETAGALGDVPEVLNRFDEDEWLGFSEDDVAASGAGPRRPN